MILTPPKIYIETTVFNYYYLTDPGRKEDITATKRLFLEIEKNLFKPFISPVVVGELEKCSDSSLRRKMLELIKTYNIELLTFEGFNEVEDLATKYILAGAIPAKKRGDALHIAIAAVSNMDILVSWNCDHIVRYKTQQVVLTVNLIEGYGEIAINTPREVISYGE